MLKVRVLESFSAFGREFTAGEIIDPATDLVIVKHDAEGNEVSRTPWDTGTISRRFSNGFLGYDTDPVNEMLDELEGEGATQVPTPTGETETLPPAGETAGGEAPARAKGRSFALPK